MRKDFQKVPFNEPSGETLSFEGFFFHFENHLAQAFYRINRNRCGYGGAV
jgi:hypothetical protein